MTGAPVLDVLISTKGRENIVALVLLSVAQQTFTRFRVVIRDESEPSLLETEAVQHAVDLLCERDIEVCFARGESRGYAHARRETARLARAEWVLFLDDEVVLGSPRLLERLFEEVERHPAAFYVAEWRDMTVLPALPDAAPFLGRFEHAFWEEVQGGELDYGLPFLLARREHLEAADPWRDPSLGEIGGEDTLLTNALVERFGYGRLLPPRDPDLALRYLHRAVRVEYKGGHAPPPGDGPVQERLVGRSIRQLARCSAARVETLPAEFLRGVLDTRQRPKWRWHAGARPYPPLDLSALLNLRSILLLDHVTLIALDQRRVLLPRPLRARLFSRLERAPEWARARWERFLARTSPFAESPALVDPAATDACLEAALAGVPEPWRIAQVTALRAELDGSRADANLALDLAATGLGLPDLARDPAASISRLLPLLGARPWSHCSDVLATLAGLVARGQPDARAALLGGLRAATDGLAKRDLLLAVAVEGSAEARVALRDFVLREGSWLKEEAGLRLASIACADPAAAPHVLDLLSGLVELAPARWRERRSAARALGWIGDEAAAPPLLDLLQGERDPLVRREAARSLVWLGWTHPGVVDALRRTLADGPPGAREWAAFALGRVVSKEDVAPLVSALQGDPEPMVRASAALALGEVGGRDACLAVAAALEDDGAPAAVLCACLDASRRWGRTLREHQRRHLTAGPYPVRRAAALVLGEGTSTLEVRAGRVEPRCRAFRNVSLEAPTAHLLGRLRGAGWEAHLDAYVRHVHLALPWYHDPLQHAPPRLAPDDAAAFVAALDDAEPDVRLVAALLLASLGRPEPRRWLLDALRSDRPDLRAAALCGLSGQPGPEVAAAIAAVLDDPVDHVRAAACWALLDRPADELPWQALRRALAHDDPQVRSLLCSVVAGIDDPEVDAALGARAEDPVEHVRHSAWEALRRRLRGEPPPRWTR